MASDPQTWAELKASVALWLVRDDLTDRIPEFIAFAERRLNRLIYGPDREATTTLTAAATVALPTDFESVRAVWLDTDPKIVMDQMTLNELRQAYSSSATGMPGNYAISGGNMILGPAPDSAYSIQLAYIQGLTALSDSNTYNWLLLDHPDLYLAATMVEARLALHDPESARLWDSRVVSKVDEINKQALRKQYGGAPFRIRSAVVV